MKNLMTNGDYETPSFNYGTKGEKSTISDYIFWGQYPQTGDTPIDFYTNTAADINPSGWADNGFEKYQQLLLYLCQSYTS